MKIGQPFTAPATTPLIIDFWKIRYRISAVGEIVKKALEKKLLVISAGSDVLRIVPPLVITKADIDEMAEILDECLA